MFEEFQRAAKTIFETAERKKALIRNPDSTRLKVLALEQPEVKQTKYGSIYADSEPMSRAAKRTTNNIDTHFGREELDLLEQAKRVLDGQEIVAIDVEVGDGTDGIPAPIRSRGLCGPQTLQADRYRQPDLPDDHVLRRGI
jgi:hypothetical protein